MKNIIKIFFTFLFTFFSGSALFAQKGFFVRAEAGNFFAVKQHYYSWIFDHFNDSFLFTSNPVFTLKNQNNDLAVVIPRASYGQGKTVGGSLGYMFGKHFGAKVGINYLFGDPITTVNEQPPGSVTPYSSTSTAKMLSVAPSIIINAGLETASPYASAGLVFGFPKITTSATFIKNNSISYEDLVNGGVAVGFNGTFGMRYPLGKNVATFLEISYTSMKYRPKSKEAKKLIRHDLDDLANTYPGGTKMDLVDEALASEIYQGAGNTNTKQLTQSLPFGNWGLKTGLEFTFGKSGLPRAR